jgi:hexokinase
MPEEMTKTLKDTTDPMVTHRTLLKIYQDHFVRTMQKGLATLTKGDISKIDNHTMSCPVKFMEHVVKTCTSEFMPHHEIQQIQNKVIEHNKALEISKDMGGFSI